MRAVEQTRAPVKYEGCGAFRLTVDTGSRLGFNVGDIVIVDPRRVATDGSTVVVCLPDGGCGVAMHQGRALISCGTAAADMEGASILGVAVQMQRDLEP
jgi:hypothetical protein